MVRRMEVTMCRWVVCLVLGVRCVLAGWCFGGGMVAGGGWRQVRRRRFSSSDVVNGSAVFSNVGVWSLASWMVSRVWWRGLKYSKKKNRVVG